MVTHKLRLAIHVLVIALISTYFWTQSRYPDLNRKAMMAKNASVADTISMYPIFIVKPEHPTYQKIAYTTANWVNDNKKGMTFGVIIGAMFLSLIGYLRFKPSENKLVSALYGTILGSPLGVCVNCAAPIFKGVLQSKQIEFSFAMMLSSPTMNMVVVTMLFSLFPLYMAVTKIAFTLIVIFGVVPLLSHTLAKTVKIQGFEALSRKDQGFTFDVKSNPSGALLGEIWGAVVDFFKAFIFLGVRTVPLMFVAGFLGSVVSHLIPFEALNGAQGPLALIVTAAVGLFLPVPMAFDLVLTNALFVGGLSPSIVMTLLCTLGIFSSYSFMIVWNSASPKWALNLSGAIFALSLIAGFLGDWMDRVFYLNPNIADYQALRRPTNPSTLGQGIKQAGPVEGATLSQGGLKPVEWATVFEDDTLRVASQPFKVGAKATGRFEKHEGVDLGLVQGFVYGIRDYPDPFWFGRGTAGGDVNRDGYVDVVFGSDHGPRLYLNQGDQTHGPRFGEVQDFIPEMKDMMVFAVALVDWDQDGWLDLFMTTFNKGNYLSKNNQGQFGSPLKIPNLGGVMTISPAFADFNGDGLLDVYNGNMALGIITGFRAYGPGRSNGMTLQKPGGGFEEVPLDVKDGETMSTIASDVNDDGFVDIFNGNDFVVPDYWFLGQKDGKFTPAPQPGLGSLATPFYSMSVDTGDLNNDLKTDFVLTGTVQMAPGVGESPIDGVSALDYTRRNDTAEVCTKRIKQTSFRDNCLLNRSTDHLIPFYKNRNLNIKDCMVLTDPVSKDDCLLSVMWMIVTSNVNITNCEEQFGFDKKIKEVCEIFIKAGATKYAAEFSGFAPQVDAPAVYLGQGQGQYTPLAITHPGGWTWSTKFADFDRDGFLDIFNAEGVVREGGFGFNVLLHNQGLGAAGGKGFEQKQFSWNLVDPFYLFSFTLIDYDHDGDLDMIGNSSIGPVQVYENRLNDHQAIAFALKFPEGNTFGLGARVTIEDEAGMKQIREVKAGGGFQSFDAPRVYFGLGQKTVIKRVWISYRGQEREVAVEAFKAGALYHLEFKKPLKSIF